MYSSHQSNSEKESTSHTSSTRKQAHNRTGIPDQVKAKYEQHSGYSLDDVRIHYNSGMPAQFHAFAFTQGNNVYIGPQQEGYLNHELGHVVQQKQGRVPVESYYNGVAINEDSALEREADNFLSYAPVRRQGEIQDNNTFADNLTFSSNIGNNGGIYDSGIMQCAPFMRALAYEENFPLEVKALCSKDNLLKKANELITEDDINKIAELSLKSSGILKSDTEYEATKNDTIKSLRLGNKDNINLLHYLDGLAGVATSVYVKGGTYIYPVGYMLEIAEATSVYSNYLKDARTTKPRVDTNTGKLIFISFMNTIKANVTLIKLFKDYLDNELGVSMEINDSISKIESREKFTTQDFEFYIVDFLQYIKTKDNDTHTHTKNLITKIINDNIALYYNTVGNKNKEPGQHYYGSGLSNYEQIVKDIILLKDKDVYSESTINAKIENVCCVWFDDRSSDSFDDRPIDPKWKAKSSTSIAVAKPEKEVYECRYMSAQKLAMQLSEGKKQAVSVVALSKL